MKHGSFVNCLIKNHIKSNVVLCYRVQEYFLFLFRSYFEGFMYDKL